MRDLSTAFADAHSAQDDREERSREGWGRVADRCRVDAIIMEKYWIYIMGSANGKAIYIGVTNNLQRRVQEHKLLKIDGFTKHYNCCHLLYYEAYSDVHFAIAREKQLKGWTRAKKEELIRSLNPQRVDLFG